MTAAPHNVVVVAFDGLQLLDLAGPVEVLRTATRLGASPPYRTMVATPDGQPVRSESGVSVAAHDYERVDPVTRSGQRRQRHVAGDRHAALRADRLPIWRRDNGAVRG